MWDLILIAMMLSAFTVLILSLGSYSLFYWILTVMKKRPTPDLVQGWWLMLRFVVALLLLHAVDVVVWVQFYVFKHCFSDPTTAYYFSLTSYTTVGFGDVVLPQ